ncbi:MAG: hypothetical protein FMNOHCHN_00098 [Ignavibacteriaceae bacterium]|nr:hypothetical protein [Ignavibacteriaceae bacterium]
MKRFLFAIFFILSTVISLRAQNSDPQVNVTIYNDNLGVIREIRKVNLTKGTGFLELGNVSQQIDATSVRIKFNGNVLEQNYQYDLVSMTKILEKYIDKEVMLIGEKDEVIEGTLLSIANNQAVIRKKSGGLTLLPNLSKYRISVDALPEGLITSPTLKLLLNANSGGSQELELAYMTGGMTWHAEYVAVLDKDDKYLGLNAWVSIQNNSGTSFKNANLKLVAGEVNRIQDDFNRNQHAPTMYYDTMEKSSGGQFEEKEFFEYHIYNLQRPADVANNEIKQIQLFDGSGIPVVKKYRFLSDYYSAAGKKDVNVIVEFENKEEFSLGVPMPKGKVRIYKSDGSSLEFVGEDAIDHTPRNEKISLKLGNAFDIVAEEVMEDYKQISKNTYESTFIVKLKNRKKEAVTINVVKNVGYNWEVKNNNLAFSKIDADTIEFNVAVKADGETELKYTLRYSY